MHAPVRMRIVVCGVTSKSACRLLSYTLQKQVGCFNHRVITMVADKLKRQWL